MLIDMKKKANSKKEQEEVHHALSQENACYVLITCGQPSEDGKMQVEMIYEGDVSLAAYLIESAQGLLDNHE
jgi:hydroxymethylpyrimidine/phosphomethylpyrimidine kinase